MKHFFRGAAFALASMIFLSSGVLAQDGGGDNTGGGDDCPDRGVKLIPASEIASDAGESCGHGIGFTYGGVTYTPSDDKCPRWIEYTPSRQVPDTATVQVGLRPVIHNTVQVTRQKYHCTGIGCGFLFLQGCCEENGASENVNELDNWWPESCTEVSGTDTGGLG